MQKLLTIILQLTSLACIKAQCWKQSYGRGVGRPLTMCPNGTELNGALCYNKCQSGYQGIYRYITILRELKLIV